MADFELQRHRMVERQLAARGIRDTRVLEAMRAVPREAFVPEEAVSEAYCDSPLAIGDGQTISQPYVVALMLESLELRSTDRALEIGTGSGYAAAVMSHLVQTVRTIERCPALAAASAQRLAALGYDNVEVRCGDGSIGWPEAAPYDAISVTAGGPSIPLELKHQLAIGGRLVMPVGDTRQRQTLHCLRRRGAHDYVDHNLGGVRFVPLIGAAGWAPVGSR